MLVKIWSLLAYVSTPMIVLAIKFSSDTCWIVPTVIVFIQTTKLWSMLLSFGWTPDSLVHHQSPDVASSFKTLHNEDWGPLPETQLSVSELPGSEWSSALLCRKNQVQLCLPSPANYVKYFSSLSPTSLVTHCTISERKKDCACIHWRENLKAWTLH